MAIEIVLPKLGNTVEECIIRQWTKHTGDLVRVDEVLCEVETDKTTMEVASTADGVLRHVFYEEGDVVAVMSVIAIVAEVDENIQGLVAQHTGAHNIEEGAAAQDGEQLRECTNRSINETKSAVFPHGTNTAPGKSIHLTYTPRARTYLQNMGLNQEQCTRHFLLERILKPDQSVVEEKDLHAFFEGMVSISPDALEALITQDKLLSIECGSGIGGRIMQNDITGLGGAASAVRHGEQPSSTAATGMEGFTEKARQPLTGMRKIIAQRMMQSLQSTAQVTLNAQADACALRKGRAYYKAQGLPITVNDIVLYVVARVLKKHTWANSLLIDDVLIEYESVNMGCAVQTPKGLMVPCIAQASEKSITELSTDMKSLALKCKEGTITPNELQNATFTVSNLGALGVQTFTPILNAPQTGILGVGGIEIRAVERSEGEVTLQSCLNLSLTFDHRVYDGADGAVLLRAFADGIAAFDAENV